jgi:hypothetical protein
VHERVLPLPARSVSLLAVISIRGEGWGEGPESREEARVCVALASNGSPEKRYAFRSLGGPSRARPPARSGRQGYVATVATMNVNAPVHVNGFSVHEPMNP